MNEIVKLYQDHPVRILERNGDPWFVAKDVCAVLDIRNSRQATSYLDDDEKDVITNDTPSGDQEMTVVSEPGLYSLILRSRKPEAKAFKRWVTHEVLPSIRKTGAYVTPDISLEQIGALAKRLIAQTENLIENNCQLREKNEYLEQFCPKGEYGALSKFNGKPKWQQRSGCYVSTHGGKPKRMNPEICGFLQLDLFHDYLPATWLADTINIISVNYPKLLETARA